MIKKIIHTADWHLEPYKNHKRFQDSIDAFIASVDKEIGHLEYEESRLVIVGDLFDNRSKEPSNEAFSLMFKTLKRLSEKYKTIVTIGNHDYDVNNKSKMDCITPVYETFKELGWDYEITYLKHSCIFEDNNVVFCNYSNYDGNLRPDIEKSLEDNPDKIHWFSLSQNPNVLYMLTRLDTNKMRDNCKAFAEELAIYVFHPERLNRIAEAYDISAYDYLECI